MKFGIIKPAEAKVEFTDHDDIGDAYALAGLERGRVDHGTLLLNADGSGISIVVYEFGFMKNPAVAHYYSIGNSLFEGNAVLFAFDERGETVDLEMLPPVTFYRGVREVELAIGRDEVNRPRMAVNDEVLWEWNIQKS